MLNYLYHLASVISPQPSDFIIINSDFLSLLVTPQIKKAVDTRFSLSDVHRLIFIYDYPGGKHQHVRRLGGSLFILNVSFLTIKFKIHKKRCKITSFPAHIQILPHKSQRKPPFSSFSFCIHTTISYLEPLQTRATYSYNTHSHNTTTSSGQHRKCPHC